MNKHTRSVSLIDGHTEEMTDAEIIKALECCIIGNHCRSDCPYDGEDDSCIECTSLLAKDALALIKRQQAEIKQLETIERFATETIEKQDAEIEKLNVELVGMRGACESYKMHYDNAQAEIERLKTSIKEADTYFCEGKMGKGLAVIINLVKEMTEVSE